MSSTSSMLRCYVLAIALAILAGCGSKLIRLGDQTAEVNSAGYGGVSFAAGGTAGSGAMANGGAEMVPGPGGDGGAAGNNDTCPHAQVLAAEVLWIGDSWITIPGAQHDRVRDLAREARAIGQNEDYFNLAAAASSMAAIAKQYDARESGATKVKVLLMDGGTWDPIAAQMAGGSAAVPAAIEASISAFQQFLGKVASDGTVEHIVYFLVPELATVPGVATMRPRLQQACAESAVPCHFIDLQQSWAGHPEYTAVDGIQSSQAGALMIAKLIWDTMQANCIAQ